jgi:regulator of protease activity HflC (stomatin/prohibitin superfamily)
MNVMKAFESRSNTFASKRKIFPGGRQRGHFRFNTISALVLLIFIALGLGFQGLITGLPDPETASYVAAGVIGAAAVLFILPYWPVVIAIIAGIWAVFPVTFGADLQFAASVLTIGLLIAPGVEVISQWDKIVVLRLGKFHKVRGPGALLLFPLIDSVAGYVDTRIRVTDFSAEKSLTRDTVPVHVDALAFWMIWDAEKAILEVENFEQAVSLSAQTALRASIGSSNLAMLLSERERLGSEIQKIVDTKTNPWGITIISVEFKEILIPKELEDALSRQAQAEREHLRRVQGDPDSQGARGRPQPPGAGGAGEKRTRHTRFGRGRDRGSFLQGRGAVPGRSGGAAASCDEYDL